MQLLHINLGTVRRLRVGERNLMSAIGKTPVAGPVAVGRWVWRVMNKPI